MLLEACPQNLGVKTSRCQLPRKCSLPLPQWNPERRLEPALAGRQVFGDISGDNFGENSCGMQRFSYSWKLPAYSGTFQTYRWKFWHFTWSWSFSLTILVFLLTVWAFCLQWDSVSNNALRAYKQRSLTVSEKASTVSRKSSSFLWGKNSSRDNGETICAKRHLDVSRGPLGFALGEICEARNSTVPLAMKPFPNQFEEAQFCNCTG